MALDDQRKNNGRISNIAEVPELPGCMAHGNTYEEAIQNIQTAIELWIDTAKEY
jgi:predicted RNase H-like HicB family nuclease